MHLKYINWWGSCVTSTCSGGYAPCSWYWFCRLSFSELLGVTSEGSNELPLISRIQFISFIQAGVTGDGFCHLSWEASCLTVSTLEHCLFSCFSVSAHAYLSKCRCLLRLIANTIHSNWLPYLLCWVWKVLRAATWWDFYTFIVLTSTSSCNEEAFSLSKALYRTNKGDRIWLLELFLLVKKAYCTVNVNMQLKICELSTFPGTGRLLLWSYLKRNNASKSLLASRASSTQPLCFWSSFCFERLTCVFHFSVCLASVISYVAFMCVLWLWC